MRVCLQIAWGLCLVMACGWAQATDKLILTGSSTVAPLAAELGKRFEQQHPDVRVDVQSGGSSRGVEDARKGLADIGMVSRALKGSETDLVGTVIARDGVSMILHTQNPVSALSEVQIIGIYTGQLRNWSELGGRDAPITVINKAQGRSTLELFLAYFKLEASQIRASVVIGDNEQGLKTLAGNPDAIGYVSVGSAEAAAANGQPIKRLPLGGVPATTENIANGRFPLARPLLLVTRGAPAGLAKRFVEFAHAPANDDLVREFGFVPQH
ncbi:MAG: phosphate ABC transporter substrate-binding protein [Panacagrimonas sp.]